MKIAGLNVQLSNGRTLADWMRNAWLSSAELHFVGSQKTPGWNYAAAQKRTVQQRSVELPERLSKTAGLKFDEGCLKLMSAPLPCSAGLTAAAAAERLEQGARRSVPQWWVRHRFAGLREVVQGKDSMLLPFRSLRLRLQSGCDRPLSAQAATCSHFVPACSELSGCRSL